MVADLRARVAEAEAKVEEFRTQSGLLVGTNNVTITTQQLGELNNRTVAVAHGAGRRAGQGAS